MRRSIERTEVLERVRYGLVVVGLFVVMALAFSTGGWAGEFEADEHTVALWHFNEGSGITLFDYSGNGNDGTIYGASWIDGKIGKALSFDGVNDYVELPNTPVLWNIPEPITYEAWVYSRNPFTLYPLILGNRWGLNPVLALIGSQGRPFFTAVGQDDVGVTPSSPNPLEANAWYYIVGTCTSSEVALYINGEKVDSLPFTTGPMKFSPTPKFIGGQEGWYWDGIIDEVRISNVARTADEISAHWEASKHEPVAVAEPGLDAENNLILDGSKSSDADGTIVSYDWSLINRNPEGNNFALTGEKTPTDTVDIGVYDVILTVVDNDGLTDMDTMVLAVPLAIPDWLFSGLNEIETLIGTPQGQRKSTSDYPESTLGDQLDKIIDMLLSPPGQSIKK